MQNSKRKINLSLSRFSEKRPTGFSLSALQSRKRNRKLTPHGFGVPVAESERHFRKLFTKYTVLLWKMTYKDKAWLTRLWSELSRMSLCGTRAEDTNIDFILYKHSTQICIYVYLCDTIFFCLHIYAFTRHKCKRIYIFVYCACHLQYNLTNVYVYLYLCTLLTRRGGGLGSRPKKMYGERLGDGVEYHLMKPTPRR